MRIEFSLNGVETAFEGDPQTPLLTFLRQSAGLVSVKDGCSGQAACGACLVELGGKPALSCSTPMARVEGKTVVTIDGFPEKVRRTLGKAFVAQGAVQCGFCTPGFITRAKILLETNPAPSREQVVKALSTQVCRCTGYQRIVDAILEAAAALREQREIVLETATGIGRSYPKYEAYERALGRIPFVDDLRFEGMLHGALKYSEHPRARILSLDCSAARDLPGVKRVFTAKDIPGRRHQGLIVHDWPMMLKPGETTRYIGDVLASVVAEDEATARMAVDLIQVEYEVLEPLTDLMRAADSPIHIHEGGNLLEETVIKRGEAVDGVFDRSAHVVEGVFETPFVEHAFIETEASLALPQGDGLKVYSQSQGIFKDRDQIASLLGIEEPEVDVVQVSPGGAFGGKEDLTVQHHAALAAWHLGRPVKFRLSRPESIRMHPKRHATRMTYKLACDEKGKLTALRARIVGDTGAYASVGGLVVGRTGTHAAGAYHVPSLDVKAAAYYTNNIPGGAFRGFGVNQSNFAMESMLDELAAVGGFDPWQMRYDNALETGLATTTGHVLGEGIGLKKCLEAIKPQYQAAEYKGLACAIKNCGYGGGLEEVSETMIRITGPNRIRVSHGWCEMGQGLHTVARQILCEVAGLDDSVEIELYTGTGENMLGGVTTASRGTMLLGRSVMQAAGKLAQDLASQPLSQLVGKQYYGRYVVDWTTAPDAPGEIISHFAYGFAAHLAVLHEDGCIRKITAAHDAGRIINPALYDSQVEGGVIMGLGYAVSEKLELARGRLVSGRMSKLGLLKAKDIPELEVIHVECPDPHGPFGAKGVGEIGTIPTAPAVANAYFNYDGQRRHALPLNPVQKKAEPE